MTLQNHKATLRHCKLTKCQSSIFYTSFCVYILMKTKPLDANMSSTHANTSSMHERGSQPSARQGSVGNTNDASPSSSDNTDKADVPSDSDNSTPKDAMSSDPGTDEESQEGNSGQPSCKLLNLHFHSKFCLTALSAASTKEHPAASHDNETEDEDGEAERLVECESCCTSMPW